LVECQLAITPVIETDDRQPILTRTAGRTATSCVPFREELVTFVSCAVGFSLRGERIVRQTGFAGTEVPMSGGAALWQAIFENLSRRAAASRLTARRGDASRARAQGSIRRRRSSTPLRAKAARKWGPGCAAGSSRGSTGPREFSRPERIFPRKSCESKILRVTPLDGIFCAEQVFHALCFQYFVGNMEEGGGSSMRSITYMTNMDYELGRLTPISS
jgi:hypothetical protein